MKTPRLTQRGFSISIAVLVIVTLFAKLIFQDNWWVETLHNFSIGLAIGRLIYPPQYE